MNWLFNIFRRKKKVFNENLFHLELKTNEDVKRELQETIANLDESQKTDYEFDGETLYEIGGGHDFFMGFFASYVTKSGVEATHYYGRRVWWTSKGKYKYKDGEFIKLPEIESIPSAPVKWEDISFPVVRQVSARTIADDIPPVQPKK